MPESNTQHDRVAVAYQASSLLKILDLLVEIMFLYVGGRCVMGSYSHFTRCGIQVPVDVMP